MSGPHRLAPWVWLVCALPGIWLWGAAFANALGANPAEALIRGLGDWALRFLLLTLAITPMRRLLNWPTLARWRRGLGLWTATYASHHALAYAWLDMGLDASQVLDDVVQRPFITVGLLALLGLWALAATSFQRTMRWLGGRRWQQLHKMVYGIVVLGVVHFYWMRAGKNDFAEVHWHAAVMAVLLGWRVWWFWKTRQSDKLRSRCH
jgi:sulfoxide reductase heme-binding subunit YedZ